MKNKKDITIRKQKSMITAHEVLSRATARGRLPKRSSGEDQEISDVNWVQTVKQSKQGIGRSIFYPEFEEIAAQHGFPGIFDPLNVKSEVLLRADEVFQRAKERSAIPTRGSKDGQWLAARKQAKKGKGASKFYPELDRIAAEYGFARAFDTK